MCMCGTIIIAGIFRGTEFSRKRSQLYYGNNSRVYFSQQWTPAKIKFSRSKDDREIHEKLIPAKNTGYTVYCIYSIKYHSVYFFEQLEEGSIF